MSLFLQRTFDSLANGSAYAALAVAISMVFRSTGILNLAQGQLAMFSTYVALVLATGPSPYMKFSSNTDLIGAAWPVWAAILGAVAISMVIGAFTERVIIRPISDNPVAAVGATLGLYLLLGAFVRKQWGGRTMFLGSPFPQTAEDRWDIGGARLWYDSVGITLTMIAVLGLLAILQRRTKAGLAFRAVTSNRTGSLLVGIRVSRVLMFGWALAAGIGALAGGLIAGEINVRPDMMGRLLVFGLAAATLGGLRSPVLAFVGGYMFAFLETMLGGYVSFVDSQVTLVWALLVLIIVLFVRPSGLMPRTEAWRQK